MSLVDQWPDILDPDKEDQGKAFLQTLMQILFS